MAPRGRPKGEGSGVGGPGPGVDALGNPVFDPTKNVDTLVAAMGKYQDSMRDARFDLAVAKLDGLKMYFDAVTGAETKRIDQLAAIRVQYDVIIENMRSTALKDTSMLLATQLRDVKVELADRMSKMEQFRWETGGRGTGQAQIISWVIAGAAVAFAIAVYLLRAA